MHLKISWFEVAKAFVCHHPMLAGVPVITLAFSFITKEAVLQQFFDTRVLMKELQNSQSQVEANQDSVCPMHKCTHVTPFQTFLVFDTFPAATSFLTRTTKE